MLRIFCRDYLYKLARRYKAKDIKRFKENKRYSLMLCFLLETRKVLLDHLVKMHDQYILDMLRKGKQVHEKKHREFRNRQKKAIDTVLDATHLILDGLLENNTILKIREHTLFRNGLCGSSERKVQFHRGTA